MADFHATMFDLKKIEAALDNLDVLEEEGLWSGKGWHQTDITLDIPIPATHGQPSTATPLSKIFTIPGLHHRSIKSVIIGVVKEKQTSEAALQWIPYRQYWNSPVPGDPEHSERLFDELYMSDAWLEEHESIQHQPEVGKDGQPCTLPRVIAGAMLWSDATQVANFGTAKLWPLYLLLGNQTKSYRGKATAPCCHHIAYFKSVSLTPPGHIHKQLKHSQSYLIRCRTSSHSTPLMAKTPVRLS